MTTQRDAEETGSPSEPTELKFVGPATAAVLETASFDAAGIRDREVSFGMLLDAGVNPGVAARIRREHSLPWSFDTETDRGDLGRRSDQVRGLNDGERDWVAASTGDWADGKPSETVDHHGETDASPADNIDPRPDGNWPATATPDDHDDPETTTAWPETATPDDHDTGAADDPDAADVGPWPETARPDGVTSNAPATGDATDVSLTGDAADAPAETDATAGRQQATADGSGDPVQAETAWRERSAPVSLAALNGVDSETRETLAAAGVTSVRSLATADPAALATALSLSKKRIVGLRETARSFLGE